MAQVNAEAPREPKIVTDRLAAWYGSKDVIRDVDMQIWPREVTAIIGPSGCGKSTFIRCLNRMHELGSSARVTGRVLVDGSDVYGGDQDPIMLRRRVGMVFQKPNPFPTMSIRDNVLSGLRLTHRLDAGKAEAVVKRSLEQAALWDEVEDRLDDRSGGLSGGQQQRLCIARALAVEPEVLLMDEPCSALDPIATAHIEELIGQLRRDYTIMIVTHNMQQAVRVSQRTAFFLLGDLIEYTDTKKLFEDPDDPRTRDYISGKSG